MLRVQHVHQIAPHDDLTASIIDYPAGGACSVGPVLDVVGWAIGGRSPVAEVELSEGGAVLARAPLTAGRDDVARLYAGSPQGAHVSFVVSTPPLAEGPHEISVSARLADGRAIAIGSIRLLSESVRDQQRQNIDRLRALGQISRVIPHHVNSLRKLSDVVADGYRGFEVDLLFRRRDGGCFEVGHDEAARSGIDLSAFLDAIDPTQLQKIWLDIKNASAADLDAIHATIVALDRRFGLRRCGLVESALDGPSIAGLADAGFRVSHHLPTEELLPLRDDPQALEPVAERLAARIHTHRTPAISFDWRLYSFVKRFLENRIRPDAVYHLWDFSTPLGSPAFVDSIETLPYFADARVETILVRYESAFSR